MVKNIDVSNLSDDELLGVRICDLPLTMDGTWLAGCVEQLYRELEEKGIRFKPPCYLADEWLAPDKEPLIGIPFFLAHPALIRLERKMMLDVEGGAPAACMKFLRHEAGHALNYAYRLYRKKKWQEVFGRFSEDYGDTYKFRPYSRNYVRHLEYFYAQYHPDEDFAETFAVWLTPGLNWHERYTGWKALDKIKYVDSLMGGIKGAAPPVVKGKKYWQASRMRSTLKNFYKKRRQFSAEDFPDFHDLQLKKMFVERTKETENLPRASDIIRTHRLDVLASVHKATGEKKYLINDLIVAIVKRCRALRLASPYDETVALLRVATYVTTLIMNYAHTGWFRGTGRKKARGV